MFQQHGAAYRHGYRDGLQLLDVDLTGMPCGPNQEGSCKGYFGLIDLRFSPSIGD